MKKLTVILMVLALVFTSAFAQGAEEVAAKKGSVYWLNFKPESDAVLQEVAKAYTAETGVEVKVVTAASGTYNETLTAEMDKSNPPTLFVVGNQGAVASWGDFCLDLTGTPIAAELSTDATISMTRTASSAPSATPMSASVSSSTRLSLPRLDIPSTISRTSLP